MPAISSDRHEMFHEHDMTNNISAIKVLMKYKKKKKRRDGKKEKRKGTSYITGLRFGLLKPLPS